LPKVRAIVRTDRADRVDWKPFKTPKGHYCLVSRDVPYPGRNLKANAVYVATLDEAWDLIQNHDHGIRMSPSGETLGDYIYPKSLKAILL
jgi:hypothetical protein